MRRLGTVDLEILHLAVTRGGTFDEKDMEGSQLKRLGVGKILDTLGSLKDRKFIRLNGDGSFSITPVAREILWGDIPSWARILRLLQTRSCSMGEITDILRLQEPEVTEQVERLRQSQYVLMSPQRRDGAVVRTYEILPEGAEVIDRAETEGFESTVFGEPAPGAEISEMINGIEDAVRGSSMDAAERDAVIARLSELRTRLDV